MSTTTIRLPDDLKARVLRAAENAGITPHGFILEAIAEKTGRRERHGQFHDIANRRLAAIRKTGKTIPWRDVRAYLEKRADGGKAVRPGASKRKV